MKWRVRGDLIKGDDEKLQSCGGGARRIEWRGSSGAPKAEPGFP